MRPSLLRPVCLVLLMLAAVLTLAAVGVSAQERSPQQPPEPDGSMEEAETKPPKLSPPKSPPTKPATVVLSALPEKEARATQIAEVEPIPVADLPRDTTALEARPLPGDALAAFRDDPAFAYDRVVAQQPSLIERLLRWIDERFFQPAGDAVDPVVQRWIVYAIAVAALVFAFLKLLGADFGGVFRRGGRPTASVDALDDIEAIKDVDLATLLVDAERAEAWSLAVRLRYLLLLQALAARDLVVWAPATTNRAYALALEAGPRADLVPVFRELTRLFEAAWYGDFGVDAALYAEVRRRFSAAMHTLDKDTLDRDTLGMGTLGQPEATP